MHVACCISHVMLLFFAISAVCCHFLMKIKIHIYINAFSSTSAQLILGLSDSVGTRCIVFISFNYMSPRFKLKLHFRTVSLRLFSINFRCTWCNWSSWSNWIWRLEWSHGSNRCSRSIWFHWTNRKLGHPGCHW